MLSKMAKKSKTLILLVRNGFAQVYATSEWWEVEIQFSRNLQLYSFSLFCIQILCLWFNLSE